MVLCGCRACVAMIGRTWLDARDETGRRRLDQPDDYVRLEIAAALDRPGVLVVPALVGGARMPDAQDLPASIQALGRRQAITIRDETWESDVDRLANIIAQHCGVGTIAGSSVQDGKITRNSRARLLRDNIVIHDGRVGSLKRFKEDAREVLAGYECGIGFESFNDVKVGDIIETYEVEEVARRLTPGASKAPGAIGSRA